MAERLVKNITTDYLTCSICWDTYLDPRMLQCGHTFCSRCLEDYLKSIAQRDVYECPICRQSYDYGELSDPAEVIKSLTPDNISVSILKAISVDASSLTENETTNDATKVLRSSDGGNKSACPRHRDKVLEVYCFHHDVVICPECAWREHRGVQCECVSASEVIQKRFNALRCLVLQQVSDANNLLLEGNKNKSVQSVRDEICRSIAEVEKSFEELCVEFKKRIDGLKSKVCEVTQKDLTIVEVNRIKDELSEKIKNFDVESGDKDLSEVINELAYFCSESSVLQLNIHELSEKISSGSLMKYVEGDLEILDAFVSSAKHTLPSKVLSYDELFEGDQTSADYVFVTRSGKFPDALKEPVTSSVDIASHYTFSASRPEENAACQLSSVAVIGTEASVIVDQGNRKLKKFKLPEGAFLCELKLDPHEPHQVANVHNSSNVVLTFWDAPQVHLVSTDPKLAPLATFKTDIEYIGITPFPESCVALSSICCKRVDVFSIEDNNQSLAHVGTIYQSSRRRTFPDRLATTTSGNIIVRKRNRNEVSCFGRNKNLMWSRRLRDKVADVTCFRGRIFASIREKNEILHFLENGMDEVTRLDVNGVKKPWSLAGFKNCLVVTEDAPSDIVHVLVFE